MTPKEAAQSTSAVERVLAAGGALVALAATVLDWRTVAAQQVIGPVTLFYLIEAPAFAWAGAAGILWGRTPLPWAMAGALFGFCIVGSFSIGPSYLPADALLGLAVLWRDRRRWRLWPRRIGLALLAAILQAGLMIAFVRVVVR